MARFPCPCCGHLTLDEGPGAYDWCRVCFWEDDFGQLRYPMRDDGANGVSLVEAQSTYQRTGVMHRDFRRKVRPPRRDEPLDEGWRPFYPARDWTDPVLEGDTWPVNAEALYYWRPTYWNGDQHRLPLPPTPETEDDRLLAHLRREVPELEDAIAEMVRRRGVASAWEACDNAARLVLEAYAAGNTELGHRVAMALAPALDEGSDLYAPAQVCIAYLEREGWAEPALRPHIENWPSPVRDELLQQLDHMAENEAERARRHEVWTELWRTGRGQPLPALVDRLRALEPVEEADLSELDWDREVAARVISDRRWLYRHPVDSVRVAWRFRGTRPPWQTLRWLARPTFAG